LHRIFTGLFVEYPTGLESTAIELDSILTGVNSIPTELCIVLTGLYRILTDWTDSSKTGVNLNRTGRYPDRTG
jgi:hypothetical protein